MSSENARDFVLRNELPELDRLAEGLRDFCLLHGMGEEAPADVRLAVEEAVSNTIRHGYLDREPHEIRLRASMQGDALVLEIEDDARAFNPLEAPLPDLTLPVEQKPVGGLGILLIRTVMDRAEYERVGGKNRLRLVRVKRASR